MLMAGDVTADIIWTVLPEATALGGADTLILGPVADDEGGPAVVGV